MSPLLSHLLVWPIVLLPLALAILYERGERLARAGFMNGCAWVDEHEWTEGVCDLCGAIACPWCRGEGAIFSGYRDRMEGGGRECSGCDGTGIAGGPDE